MKRKLALYIALLLATCAVPALLPAQTGLVQNMTRTTPTTGLNDSTLIVIADSATRSRAASLANLRIGIASGNFAPKTDSTWNLGGSLTTLRFKKAWIADTVFSGVLDPKGKLIFRTDSTFDIGGTKTTLRPRKGFFADTVFAARFVGPVSGSVDSLITARTLWSQTFNGTANVTGRPQFGSAWSSTGRDSLLTGSAMVFAANDTVYGQPVWNAAQTFPGSTTSAGYTLTGGALRLSAQNGSIASSAIIAGAKNSDYGAIGYNAVPGASTYTYGITDVASQIYFNAGGIDFRTAPSGTAAGTITFVTPLSIAEHGPITIRDSTAAGAGDVYMCKSATHVIHFGAACAASTLKVKTNVVSLTEPGKTGQLRPVTFSYRTPYYKKRDDIGFIAEEVTKVDRRFAFYAEQDDLLLTGEKVKKGDPIALNTTAILASAVLTIQSLERRLDAICKSGVSAACAP